jgi:uncharacterized membrane protein
MALRRPRRLRRQTERFGPKAPRALAVFAMWSGVVLLVIIGVGAAVGRGVFRADFGARADPVRRQVLQALDFEDPLLAQRPAELDRFDRRYASHPVATILHVLPGGILLILAPLQFSSWIRSRHIRFHRWSGRFLMLAALVTTAAGLYFGLRMPYGGAGEVTAIAFFGGLFLFAVGRAFVAIRTGRVALHREWMIRAFAIAIGVSTVRVAGALLDVALTPSGTRPADVFALSLWIGWGATLAAGEVWIRYTRKESRWPAAPAIVDGRARRATLT